MKSKTLFTLVILSLFMVSLLGLVGCGAEDAAEPVEDAVDELVEDAVDESVSDEVFEISFAHHWPAGHEVETVMAQGWAQAVEEATGGRVKVTTYPGETLIPAAENYEGVVTGLADVGLSVYAYTRGRFPVIETFLLPGINAKSAEALGLAATEVINEMNPEEIQDTKQLWTFGSGPMDLLSNVPVREMEDFRGLELGVPGGKGPDTLEALGGNPVSLPASEWYEALQKGVMQGGFIAANAVEGFRLGEVTADYITLTPFMPQQLFFCVMNLDTWNSFPEDIQEIITEVTNEFYPNNVPAVWDIKNVGALERLAEEKDIEYIHLDDAEMEKWISMTEPIQAEYVEELNAKGFDGEAILQLVLDTIEKYNNSLPDVSYGG